MPARRTRTRRPTKKATAAPPAAPIEAGPGQRLWFLDVPYPDRGIANAHGARWDAARRATVYVGATLPAGLTPYASHPFSWERWLEDDANGTPGDIPPAAHTLTPRPHQSDAATAIARAAKAGARGFLLADDVGLGKAQPLDSLVLTPRGFKRMGDLSVGEQVVNPDGGAAKVLAIYPQGVRPVFRIDLADGSSVRCDENHLWAVNTTVRNSRGNAPLIKTTRELLDDIHVRNGSPKWYIAPMSAAPNLDCGKERPLDPYLLAVLLGDGGIKYDTVTLSTADQEIVKRVENALPKGVHLVKSSGYDWRISRDATSGPNPVSSALEVLGVRGRGSATKFVPQSYLEAPADVRLAVLQGLMDTDGSITKQERHLDFTCTSEQLSNDVAWLVRSLGGYAQVRERTTWYTTKSGERKDGRNAFRVSISNLPPEIKPFRLARKADLYRPPTRRINRRAIVGITPDGAEPTQCILLDSENHLYLTDNFTVTHNTVAALEGVRALQQIRPVRTLLIVSPLAVVPHWRRTVADIGLAENGIRVCVINYDRLKKLLTVPTSAQAAKRTATKNRRTAREGVSLVDWDVVIFDEAHKLRNATSQRSQAASRLAGYSERRESAPFVLWLSATLAHAPVEMSFLGPILAQATGTPGGQLRSFGEWLLNQGFHVRHEPRFDKWLWTDSPQERASDVAKIRALLFDRKTALAVRRLPTDVAGWPEVTRSLFPVDLSPEQRRLYDQAWTEFRHEMQLARRGRDPKNAMVARLRFRQKASLLRVSGTVEQTLDLLENGHQVIVACQFLESLDQIRDELAKHRVSVAVMDGRNPAEREAERLHFQRGEKRVVLVTPVEGYSLHQGETLADGSKATDAPRSLIVHDLRFSGIEQVQLEGRGHRDGQAAHVYLAFGSDTAEEEVARLLLQKVESMKAMVGDEIADIRDLEEALEGPRG